MFLVNKKAPTDAEAFLWGAGADSDNLELH